MQQSAAAWLVEIALALRVFGPDTVRICRRLLTAGVRICRRLLTAGVRIGITGLAGTRTQTGTDQPSQDAL
ncbi:hypothetical protein [Streptomyces sp. NPDC057301]|uniref:hypothetical protein n=1 Tax=Streptomyces sp. NPDC057301 TaxID=3346093 RepID=UPI003631392D